MRNDTLQEIKGVEKQAETMVADAHEKAADIRESAGREAERIVEAARDKADARRENILTEARNDVQSKVDDLLAEGQETADALRNEDLDTDDAVELLTDSFKDRF